MGKTELNVKLLSYSMDSQENIAMAMRLCYSEDGIDELAQREGDDAKYINRVMKMGHLSTVEHSSFTFGIEGVSRALLAQITRHRLASFSVQSQRYVCKKNTEGTFSYIIPPSIEALGAEAVKKYEDQMRTMQGWYNDWVDELGNRGQDSNQDARFVLPNACETKMIMTMNARELLHFFELRCCNRAQWEIRELAWRMMELVYPIAPAVFGCAGPSCLNGGCSEGRMSCGRAEEVKARKADITDGR